MDFTYSCHHVLPILLMNSLSLTGMWNKFLFKYFFDLQHPQLKYYSCEVLHLIAFDVCIPMLFLVYDMIVAEAELCLGS
jgi:hypothetical protein